MITVKQTAAVIVPANCIPLKDVVGIVGGLITVGEGSGFAVAVACASYDALVVCAAVAVCTAVAVCASCDVIGV